MLSGKVYAGGGLFIFDINLNEIIYNTNESWLADIAWRISRLRNW